MPPDGAAISPAGQGNAMTCDHCNQPWEIASPGTSEIRDMFLMRAPTPDRFWCLHHAVAAGFPWLSSEKGKAA
jgi:hypothetical protein